MVHILEWARDAALDPVLGVDSSLLNDDRIARCFDDAIQVLGSFRARSHSRTAR